MKKSVLKIFAVASAAAIALTACGTSLNGGKAVKLDPDNPVAIEIWHYYNGQQLRAFNDMVAEFNETVGQEQGIIVEAFSQGNISQLMDKVIDSANKKVGSEDIPDIFAAYADTAYQIDRMGLAANLDNYLTAEELSGYVPEYIEEGRIGSNGELKIFPIAKSTEIMMLNKTDWDKFSSDTGASLDDLETIEGITKVSKSYYQWTDGLTEKPDDGKAFFGRDAIANYFIIGYKQFGVDLFSVKDGEVTFQPQKNIMKKLWDNYYVPYVNGWFGAYGNFRADDAQMGDLIAFVGSTSGATYFPDQVKRDDIEGYPIEMLVFKPPCFQQAPYKVAVQQGAGMVVTKSDSRTEYACSVFLKWFTEDERNIKFSIDSGYMPVKKTANQVDKVLDATAKMDQTNSVKKFEKTLPVSIETVNEYELYTNKAFNGGTKARNVLETSMQGQAKKDSAEVDKLVSEGMGRPEAAAKFTTDDNFERWYADFVKELESSIQ